MALLDDITEQKEKRNVVYDSDGIIYLSCYKYRETENIELMYMDFFMRLHSIEAELWKSYAIDEMVIAITSKKNFRHDLTDRWKDDRKSKPESEMTERQLESHREATKLRKYVSQVKALMAKRLPSSLLYVNNTAEADDTFIDLCNNKGYLGVTTDSDCINQSESPIFNYHKAYWKWIHEGRHPEEIFKHIITDTITGGHNGSFGVKGKGKVFATKFIEQLETSEKGFSDWIDLFETPEDALLNYRVADCSQVIDGKLKLVSIKDISNLFDTYFECPF